MHTGFWKVRIALVKDGQPRVTSTWLSPDGFGSYQSDILGNGQEIADLVKIQQSQALEVQARVRATPFPGIVKTEG